MSSLSPIFGTVSAEWLVVVQEQQGAARSRTGDLSARLPLQTSDVSFTARQ